MLVVVAACGDDASPSQVAPALPLAAASAPARPTDAPPSTPASAAPRGLALHEWGFIGFDALSTEAAPAVNVAPPEAAALTGLATAVGGGTGSVIYVHLQDASPSVELAVRFGVGNGFQVVEQWPRASGPQDGWARVSARTGECDPTTYPAPTDDVCETEDGVCSSATTAPRETEGTSCLERERVATRTLGYRPTLARLRLPIDVRRRGTDLVVVRSHAGAAPIPVVRVIRGADGSVARVARFEVPEASRSIPLPAATALEEGFRGVFSDALGEGGFTTPERAAVERTLLAPLFDAGGAGEPSDALYYVLTTPEVDRLLPITVDPIPQAVRRFLLVRISLSPLPRRRWTSEASPTFRARTDGMPVVSGGSVDLHRRVVVEHLPELEACAEKAYRPGQLIAERVVVRYELEPSGRVRTASVDGPAGSNRRVVACVETAFLGFEFPPSSAPIALGRVPLSILALPPR